MSIYLVTRDNKISNKNLEVLDLTQENKMFNNLLILFDLQLFLTYNVFPSMLFNDNNKLVFSLRNINSTKH